MTEHKWESEAEIAARLRAITEELRKQRMPQLGSHFTRPDPKHNAADASPPPKSRKNT